MAKNIHSHFENLQFMDMESVQIDDGETQGPSLAGDVKFGLIGKFLSPKLATKVVVVHNFTNIWVEEKAEIFPLKNGVLLFKFPSEQQRLSILRRSPWLFDGEPIVMVQFDPSLSLNEYKFTKILYWVRIYELPLNMMMMEMASIIGSRFDKLITIDTRHSINVNNPLLRCVMNGKHANVSTAIEQALNPGIGISPKELDELTKIADELGVNSSLFVVACVAPTIVVDRGKEPIATLLNSGFEHGSSSKGVDAIIVEQVNVSTGGIETVTACATIEQIQEHIVLPTDLDPGSLSKVSQYAGSSCMMQILGIEHETLDVPKAGKPGLSPVCEGNVVAPDGPDVVVVMNADVMAGMTANPHNVDPKQQRCCTQGLLM
ncbi:hypothetical protein V6N13_124786 [Hibiscus sabdariffa]